MLLSQPVKSTVFYLQDTESQGRCPNLHRMHQTPPMRSQTLYGHYQLPEFQTTPNVDKLIVPAIKLRFARKQQMRHIDYLLIVMHSEKAR
jgi:hypothetical protein